MWQIGECESLNTPLLLLKWPLFRVTATCTIHIELWLDFLHDFAGKGVLNVPSEDQSDTRHCSLCLKNVTTLSCYNFDIRQSIWMIFSRNVTEKVSNENTLLPPHVSSTCALPGEIGNSEIASFHLNAACCFTKNIRVLELWQMIPQILPFSMGLAGRHYNSVRTTMLQYDDAMHQQNDGLYQFSRRNWWTTFHVLPNSLEPDTECYLVQLRGRIRRRVLPSGGSVDVSTASVDQSQHSAAYRRHPSSYRRHCLHLQKTERKPGRR